MIFICYPKCSTCRRALAWLDKNNIAYTARDIKEDAPSADELAEWQKMSGLPLKKFFNTSGMLYRELGLMDRLPKMDESEMLSLLGSDGMLVKRPLLACGDAVLIGFKETEWAEKLLPAGVKEE